MSDGTEERNEVDGRDEVDDSDEPDADGDGADDHDHALPLEDLQYPEYVFDEGEIGEYGGFDLSADLDREEIRTWLEDLAGGLASHDVAVESPDGYVTLGVAPEGVEMRFDPDDDCVGEFEFSVQMRAKAMFVADDPDGEKVGARGGKGFIPIEALTTDDEKFRCYNWVEDPTDP
ncbi:hypothetical protein [Halorussus halophilus]|uniref:hypothetical protein n=1 Tax=Halorussus halophilus TaxID=2650975 RepID=UPI0013012C5A|nr:hypothetical protein [Halorussus halophilus]